MWKVIVAVACGFVVGAFVVKYNEDAKFAHETNAHVDAVIGSAAHGAHQALTSDGGDKP